MRGFVLGAIFVLGLGFGSGAAQSVTPTPRPSPTPVAAVPFQDIKVDQFLYQVDAFYPCAFTITSRVTKLTSDEDGVIGPTVSTITYQPFLRVGDQMTPIDATATFDSEITEGAAVGSWFICVPQTAAEVRP